jgi:hypothetical protein
LRSFVNAPRQNIWIDPQELAFVTDEGGEIDIYEGVEYQFQVQFNNANVTGPWLMTEPVSRDYAFTGSGDKIYNVPIRTEIRPRQENQISLGYLSEVGLDEWAAHPLTTKIDNDRFVDGSFGITVGGESLVFGEDFNLILNTKDPLGEDHDTLRFETPVDNGVRVRYKVDLVETASGQGSSTITFTVPAGYTSRTLYLHDTDYTVAPLVIRVRQSPENHVFDQVPELLPEWVANNHPKLVKFFELYLENQGLPTQPEHLLRNLVQYTDIDEAPAAYLQPLAPTV